MFEMDGWLVEGTMFLFFFFWTDFVLGPCLSPPSVWKKGKKKTPCLNLLCFFLFWFADIDPLAYARKVERMIFPPLPFIFFLFLFISIIFFQIHYFLGMMFIYALWNMKGFMHLLFYFLLLFGGEVYGNKEKEELCEEGRKCTRHVEKCQKEDGGK